jgi:hypothetical protein
VEELTILLFLLQDSEVSAEQVCDAGFLLLEFGDASSW